MYSKGNWQLAIIDAQNSANNGFRIIRIKFIKEVVLHANTFNLSEHTRKFLLNMESFYDGYDVEPYTCEVAVSPKILKFFEAKKFFRSQKIEGKFKNGWSRVSYEISSDDMILMLAQRFFPHFMILSPHTARKKFDAQIREYLQNEKLEFE
nr:WYL domain-containing protein [uncultured Campylobacter sp.]